MLRHGLSLRRKTIQAQRDPNHLRDDVHIQLATLNGKLPVLGGWVSGLAVNT